jgi:hypothetical protein
MRISALTGKLDRRVYNIPPPSNTAPKRFDKTLSFRVEADIVDELEQLLKRRYGSKRVPMNSVSFVLRTALKKKIKELMLSQAN